MIATTPADVQSLLKEGVKSSGRPDVISVLIPDSANTDSPFANQKVRQAVEYALNREGVAKAMGYGLWTPAYQLARYSYAYVPDLQGRSYDPVKAKQLLADAGYANGFKTAIIYTGTGGVDTLTAFATDLKAVGIDAALTPVDVGRMRVLQTGGWHGLLATQFRESTDWLLSLNTTLATDVNFNVSVQKPAGWKDALDQALTASDNATKSKLSQQLVRKAFDDAMVIPEYSSGSLLMIKDYVNATYTETQGSTLRGGAVVRGGSVIWDGQNYWLSKK